MSTAPSALSLAWLVALTACAGSPSEGSAEPALPPRAPVAQVLTSEPRLLSMIGTNDLHGRIARLPALGAYVARLRALRASDGGVLLLDAGDMFQGTIESNSNEGRAVVAAYNALGYTAAAVGNHDFDYGPSGEGLPAPGADPRGALRARLEEAAFPMLSANLVDQASGRLPELHNLAGGALVEVAGVKVGLVGAITHETPNIVLPAYFAGLGVTPLAAAIESEARSLRARGARIVVAITHAGGVCQRFDDPDDVSACAPHEEIQGVVRALAPGSVDAVFAGHTHQGMAHRIAGVPVLEAYAYGRAFSRIDFRVPAAPDARAEVVIFPPRDLCSDPKAAQCTLPSYEGATLQEDSAVRDIVEPYLRSAEQQKRERLGVTLTREARQEFKTESPLGNLLTDLLRGGAPDADVAVLNGGGLRAALPAGELTYGQLYECQPFDNRLARVRLSGAELRDAIALHLARDRHGIVSLSGIAVDARCERGKLFVRLRRQSGRLVRDDEALTVVTSDYLATGGDELFSGKGVTLEVTTVRDALAEAFRRRGGSIDPEDRRAFDPKAPRLRLPGPRPLRCPAP